MLNEKIEYKGYTELPEYPRITAGILEKKEKNNCKCKGIRRILVTLARGYLFETYNYAEIHYNGRNKEEILEIRDNVKEELAAWCDEYGSWCGKNDGDKGKEFAEQLKAKTERWYCEDGNMYSVSWGMNAIAFPLIISEAIQTGPLMEYVFAVKSGWWENLVYINDNNKEYKGRDIWNEEGDLESNLKANPRKNAQRMMKQICAFLLERYRSVKEYVPINNSNLGHWMAFSSIADGKNRFTILYEKGGSKTDLLEKGGFIVGTNCFRMDPDFVKEYDPQVIERDHLENFQNTNKGYLFYEEIYDENSTTDSKYVIRRIR
ncbi:MAG: hypothetical protein K6A72_09040 [Lachnospiraceae bacterium]|nr:hypothetical protein [Lachnospiraceae bacterium]